MYAICDKVNSKDDIDLNLDDQKEKLEENCHMSSRGLFVFNLDLLCQG